MPMKTKRRTLREQAWQSGLALWNQNAEWNPNDWPPLTGGWRRSHASIVLDHPHPETVTKWGVLSISGVDGQSCSARVGMGK